MSGGVEGCFGLEERLDSMDIDAESIPARHGVDMFAQAMKVLTERSPNDDEAEKDGGGACGQGVSVLPAQLVGLLAKHMDSRKKKKKKLSSGVESKKKSTSRQRKGMSVWIDNEVYFRDLTMADIETLVQLSRFLTSDCMKYFYIPVVGGGAVAAALSGAEVMDGDGVVVGAARSGEDMISTRVHSDSVTALERICNVMVSIDVSCDSVHVCGRSGEDIVPGDSVTDTCGSDDETISIGGPSICVGPGSGSVDEMEINNIKVMKLEKRKEVEEHTRKDVCTEKEKFSSPLPSPRSSLSVEWVLGSKNKILLASERPNKKRKLLGENAGLEKLIVSQPCERNPNLCHVCSQGEKLYEPFNRLIVCSACGVSVHRKCYGIEKDDVVEPSWLCSWCKHKNNFVKGSMRNITDDNNPCLLCPKKGGALKPLKTNDIGDNAPVKFSHLFCSQWMPEVFVEDTKRMEPIMNVDIIQENRKKLICSICKVKYGACVRCSNGTCRASFHPICAREAGNRTEIWGKAGGNDVELRAFCSKHSDIPSDTNYMHQVDSLMRTGGETSQAVTSSEVLQNGLSASESGRKCGDFSATHLEIPGSPKKLNGELVDVEIQNSGVAMNLGPEICRSRSRLDAEVFQNNCNASVKPSVACLLKRLIDQGKVDVEEIALEMGMLPDSLAATVASGTLTGDLQNKTISWLKNHAHLGSLEKNIRVKFKSPTRSKDKLYKEASSLETQVSNYASELDGYTSQSLHDLTEKEFHDPAMNSSAMVVTADANPSSANGETVIANSWISCDDRPYVHMSVYKMLMQLKSEIPFSEADDCRLKNIASLDSSPHDGLFCNHVAKNSDCSNTYAENGHELVHLSKAKALGIFDNAPEDELEGELVYFQHRLLASKLKRKRFIDCLVPKAVTSLPSQIDFARNQIWDSLFVNKYLAEVREVKRQGRKEKRHQEAQAVLAAATAAAASSSRLSTFRKDDLDESSAQELMHPPQEIMSRVAVPKDTTEKQCDFFQSNKETVRSCDVCLRQETILNSILVCSTCKVAVHLDCYRPGKDFNGPWQCELCEDNTSKCCNSVPVVQSSWDKPVPSAECVVCGGTVGAFRKAVDGRWIHALCAEWALQSTFRRGQTDPIETPESLSRGNDACCVCRLKKGVCLKCHFGHCQSTFHPYCARSAGFYMSNKLSGSKILHKAYCGKHSSDQRTKDENQKHGTEELKNVKQIRVELERLRLLCERIVKREKLKRDLLLCSHDILSSKKDSVAFSALLRSPYFHPGISSDSAATSLYNSGSEAIQKSDDVTVDSTSSVKKPPSLAGSMANDRKTDDSSNLHLVFARKNAQRVPFAGKKIPNRTLSISQNLSDDNANKLKFRKV